MSEFLFQVFQRAKTFQINCWKYQDERYFCPYKLASIGYFVSRPNMIECCVCHHIVEFQQEVLNPEQKIKMEVYQHKDNCIYQGQKMANIKKQDLYLRMDEIIIQAKTSYKLLQEQKKYPFLNIFEINKLIAKQAFTLNKVLQGYQLNQKQIKITFYLQLFNWKVTKNGEGLEVQCMSCGRKIKITPFQSTQFDKQYQYSNILVEKLFNPIQEHRYFCLWVNSNLDGYSGWQLQLQHLYDKMIQSKFLFSKRSPQQTKKIRVQLDKYLQNFEIKTSEQFQKIKEIIKNCQQISSQIVREDQKKRNAPTQDYMMEFKNNIQHDIRSKIKKIKLEQ